MGPVRRPSGTLADVTAMGSATQATRPARICKYAIMKTDFGINMVCHDFSDIQAEISGKQEPLNREVVTSLDTV